MIVSHRHLITSTLASAALIFHLGIHGASAQTNVESTFTYQGQLQLSGEPFSGEVEMVFRLFGVDEGGSELAPSVTVENLEVSSGIFSADLDFGYDTFDGTARWIEIEVDGTVLEPRQPIMATPYALFALDGNEGPPGPQGPEGASPFELVNDNAIFSNGQVAIGRTSPAGNSKLTVQSGDSTAGHFFRLDSGSVLQSIGTTSSASGQVTTFDSTARTSVDPEPGLTNRILLRLLSSNFGQSAAASMEATWVDPIVGQTKADLIFRTNGEDGLQQGLHLTHDGLLAVGNPQGHFLFPGSGIDVRTGMDDVRAAYLQTENNEVIRTRGKSTSNSGIVTSASFWARAQDDDPQPGLTNRLEFFLQGSVGGYIRSGVIDVVAIDTTSDSRKADMVFRTHGEGATSERFRITHDGGIIAKHFNTASGVGGSSTVVSGDRNVEFAKGADSNLSGWYRFWNEFPENRIEHFRIDDNGNARLRGSLTQNSFDIAESFLRTDNAQPGQLIAVDPGSPHSVRLATSNDGGAVIGVVSTEPGFVLGGTGMDIDRFRATWGEDVYQRYKSERADLLSGLVEAKPALADKVDKLEHTFGHAVLEHGNPSGSTQDDQADAVHSMKTRLESMVMDAFAERHLVEVALAGRVPVQVDATHGVIEVGDYLAASPTPGVAKRATSPGPVIGTALENHHEGEGEIIVFVHRGHYHPHPAEDSTTKDELRETINELEERLERLEALLGE